MRSPDLRHLSSTHYYGPHDLRNQPEISRVAISRLPSPSFGHFPYEISIGDLANNTMTLAKLYQCSTLLSLEPPLHFQCHNLPCTSGRSNDPQNFARLSSEDFDRPSLPYANLPEVKRRLFPENSSPCAQNSVTLLATFKAQLPLRFILRRIRRPILPELSSRLSSLQKKTCTHSLRKIFNNV
jgi:hypothetical protein